MANYVAPGQWIVFGFANPDVKDRWLRRAEAAGLIEFSESALFAAQIHGKPSEAIRFILDHLEHEHV